MTTHITPEFPITEAIGAITIAMVYIILSSLVKEPNRQKSSAIIIAGAGAVYLSGGLGIWEFVFCIIMTFIAFKGLSNYYFISLGWLMHSAWDLVHHFYGNPIVFFDPASSAGCCVCDAVIAVWFLLEAPSVLDLFKPKITAQ